MSRRHFSVINFNMGCIETFQVAFGRYLLRKINFNMGCIETAIKEVKTWELQD